MTGPSIRPFCSQKTLRKSGIVVFSLSLCMVMAWALLASAGSPLQKCSISHPAAPGCTQERTSRGPSCGIEMTCIDRPVQLGYSDGVCFRASCPGVWALNHRRIDQASFRRRFLTYRHYSFRGTWELKDSGVIESGVVPLRELFLVLPDDLIEFKLRDPDCNSIVEVTNLGYVKKGTVCELKQWLAYNVYLERPERTERRAGARNGHPASRTCATGLDCLAGGMLSRILSVGRSIGLPFCY